MKVLQICLTILFVFTFACNNQTTEEFRVQKFKDFMGPEISEALDLGADLLDSIVVNNTSFSKQNIDSAYFEFMTELKYYRIDWNELIIDSVQYQEFMDRVKSSGLYNELFLILKDIYHKDKGIIAVYEHLPSDTSEQGWTSEYEYICIDSCLSKIDSFITEIKSKREYYTYNKYVEGLRLIMDSDSTLINFVDSKEAAGQISSGLIAHGLLYAKADFSDYIIKRILAVELLI